MPKLYPEDQARVDEVLSRGIYKEDRPPFRFFKLLGILVLSLVGISVVSYLLALHYGFV